MELFNEKAGRLQESRFYAWLRNGPKQADFAKILAGDWLAYAGLHPDDLDAFCLNLRLLIQPGERYSLKHMPEIYKVFGEEAGEAARLAGDALAELVEYLKEDSVVQLDDKSRLSNWGLFEIIFYGGLAHSNESKIAHWHRLTRKGIFSVFTFWGFIGTVHRYMNCITKLGAMNQAILKHHPSAVAARKRSR
jgi:hypothetical protein